MIQDHASTIHLIAGALKKLGLENSMLQAGIVSVVTTEGGFEPKSEMSYAKTPNDRLRLLFGKRIANVTEEGLLTLKNSDVAFFDVIYGGLYGNTAVGDGWKYRGRGFNQITYRSNYEQASTDTGVDLVTNPDRLNEPSIAAYALAGFFARTLSRAWNNGQIAHKYPHIDYLNPDSLNVAALLAFQSNAGWGTDISRGWFETEHERQMANINEIYKLLNLQS